MIVKMENLRKHRCRFTIADFGEKLTYTIGGHII